MSQLWAAKLSATLQQADELLTAENKQASIKAPARVKAIGKQALAAGVLRIA